MKSMRVKADIRNLEKVLQFVEEYLEEMGCSMKMLMKIQVVVEEAFANIAFYAYKNKDGHARIYLDHDGDVFSVEIVDKGIPFNPLEKEETDITLSAEERKIGGLGILMMRKMMDDISYRYENGENRLLMKKNIFKDKKDEPVQEDNAL